ncbi:MAG: hypothetical protein JW829_09575, partial [Pirellulales bacterium]|nr:hypothetical protein [Pirellulales bacterium]
MAMVLTMALILGITQLLTIVAQQSRQACQYAVAIQEAGNQMEELVARNWHEITMDHLSTMTLSKTSSASLPDAKLDVDVVEEEDDVRRICVRIDWCSAPGQRSGP